MVLASAANNLEQSHMTSLLSSLQKSLGMNSAFVLLNINWQILKLDVVGYL